MTSARHIDETTTFMARIERFLEPRRLLIMTSLVSLICIGLIMFVDRPVAVHISRTIEEPARQIWITITRFGLARPYFIFFIFVFLAARFMFVRTAPMTIAGWYANAARFALFGFLCAAVAGIVVNVIKFAVGRARPPLLLNEGDYGFDPGSIEWAFNSFPSGHAQVGLMMATILALAIPRLSYLFFFAGSMIALSRVMIGVHYASDIVFGAFVGISTALLLKKYVYGNLESLSFVNYRTASGQTDMSASGTTIDAGKSEAPR